jgi:hypothetical protein
MFIPAAQGCEGWGVRAERSDLARTIRERAPMLKRISVPQSVPVSVAIFAKCWSEWQDLNLRPPRPERGPMPEDP